MTIHSNINCPKCQKKMQHCFAELFYDHKNGNQFVEVHYMCPHAKGSASWIVIRYVMTCGCVRSYPTNYDYSHGEQGKPDMTLRESVILGGPSERPEFFLEQSVENDVVDNEGASEAYE
jgi:hypothetical protein